MTATRLHARAVIRLSPLNDTEDAAAFLQGLLTNDISGEQPIYTALLTPQGKTQCAMIAWPGGNGDWLLDCEASEAEALVKRLSLYRLRRKISIAIDPAMAVHWQMASREGAAPDPRLPALGRRWLAPAAEHDAGADDAWLAQRLTLGVMESAAELADVLWLETNAVELNGVSFTKGCYIGQENTARMNWRQKVNRRLVIVPLGQSDEKRRKVAYPEFGKAVDLLRVSDINASLLPEWQRGAIQPASD